MRIKTRPHIVGHHRVVHGSAASYPGLADNVIDFSSNVNPLGAPSTAKQATFADLEKYPDTASARLKERLAEYARVPHSRITVGNGASELIYDFCRAFVLEKMPVLVLVPAFGEYEAACRLAGARITPYKTMNAASDIDDIIRCMPHGGCIFACNPNNPTGSLVPKKAMREMTKAAAERNALVFLDECFIEMAQADESLIHDKCDNLFVLRSLTKSFGLAGVRAGYGIGSRKMIDIMDRIKVPWSVSGYAQYIATKALADASHIARTKRLLKREYAYLRRELAKVRGISCYDSAANFILIRTDTDSKTVQKELLRKGILVRDCSSFAGLGRNHIRVAIKTRKENRLLVEALS